MQITVAEHFAKKQGKMLKIGPKLQDMTMITTILDYQLTRDLGVGRLSSPNPPWTMLGMYLSRIQSLLCPTATEIVNKWTEKPPPVRIKTFSK